MGAGTFIHCRNQKFRVFQTRKFSKNVKKAMKNLEYFENFKGNFAIFWKFCRNVRENLGKNLENFWNMDLYGVPSENIKKLVEKSIETGKILKIFMHF